MNLAGEREEKNLENAEKKKVKAILKRALSSEETFKEIEKLILDVYARDRKVNGYRRRVARGFYLNPSAVEKLEFMKYVFKVRGLNVDGSDIVSSAIEIFYLLIEPDLNKFFYDKKKTKYFSQKED